MNELQSDIAVPVEPADMLRYVHERMVGGRGRAGDSEVARAAELRWTALNRAFGDERLGTWAWSREADRIHVPAALIAAAGVARLTRHENAVVFDIPALLDATLELCEPAGHA
ncbi:MAG: hypothetical protein KGI55_10210 [Gammaproteobacteria bacterium]|nr:hypothetical protein [Gammaproteobacteria bacterium]